MVRWTKQYSPIADEGHRVRLQPRNPAMQPILEPADQVEVREKVVKLVRDL